MTNQNCTKFVKCSVDDCDNNSTRASHGAKGLCSSHYQKHRKSPDFEPRITKFEWLVNKLKVSTDDCILWPFYINKNGYGRICVDSVHKTANRQALILHTGVDNPDLFACHTCKNKACINVSHLYWGTPKQNSADKYRDGTQPLGSALHSSTTDEKTVLAIYQSDSTYSEMASKFNVTKDVICQIKCGKTWSHLTGHDKSKTGKLKGSKHHQSKIDESVALAIYNDSRRSTVIARDFNITKHIVYNIKNGKSWSWLTKHHCDNASHQL